MAGEKPGGFIRRGLDAVLKRGRRGEEQERIGKILLAMPEISSLLEVAEKFVEKIRAVERMKYGDNVPDMHSFYGQLAENLRLIYGRLAGNGLDRETVRKFLEEKLKAKGVREDIIEGLMDKNFRIIDGREAD